MGVVGIGAWGLLGAIIGLLASAVTTMFVMFWRVLRTGIMPSSRDGETPGFAVVNDDIGLGTGAAAGQSGEGLVGRDTPRRRAHL